MASEELDLEFLRLLRIMKPFITCIMNNHYIDLIRMWLEKLSDPNFVDKINRNKYLAEFGRQIEIGIFEEPFTDPPIDGDLPPFEVYENTVENDDTLTNQEDICNYISENIYNENNLNYAKDYSNLRSHNVPRNGKEVCDFKKKCCLMRQGAKFELNDVEEELIVNENGNDEDEMNYETYKNNRICNKDYGSGDQIHNENEIYSGTDGIYNYETYEKNLVYKGKQIFRNNRNYRDGRGVKVNQNYVGNQNYIGNQKYIVRQNYIDNQKYKDYLNSKDNPNYKDNQISLDSKVCNNQTYADRNNYDNQMYKDDKIFSNQIWRNKIYEGQNYISNQIYENQIYKNNEIYKNNQTYKDEIYTDSENYTYNQVYKDDVNVANKANGIYTDDRTYENDQIYTDNQISTENKMYDDQVCNDNQIYMNHQLYNDSQIYRNKQIYKNKQLYDNQIDKCNQNFKDNQIYQKSNNVCKQSHKQVYKDRKGLNQVYEGNQNSDRIFKENQYSSQIYVDKQKLNQNIRGNKNPHQICKENSNYQDHNLKSNYNHNDNQGHKDKHNHKDKQIYKSNENSTQSYKENQIYKTSGIPNNIYISEMNKTNTEQNKKYQQSYQNYLIYNNECYYSKNKVPVAEFYPEFTFKKDEHEEEFLEGKELKRDTCSKGSVENESSWYDVSEASLMSRKEKDGSGDAASEQISKTEEINTVTMKIKDFYECKIYKLLSVIEDLKKENGNLKEVMEKSNNIAEKSIQNLTKEVKSLKYRLQELIDIKSTLQNSHQAVITEWQARLNMLQIKYEEEQQKCSKLQTIAMMLEKKFEKLKSKKARMSLNKKRSLNENIRELQSLKDLHVRTIKELQENFEEKILEIEKEHAKQLQEVKNFYEGQIGEMKAEYGKNITFKDSEIERLEKLLREQCERMQNEVKTIKEQVTKENLDVSEAHSEKITFLQKCILKMEKLYQKSEKDYLKQIAKLRYELDLKEKTIQIQLSKQKADILTSMSELKQEEVDSVANKLEQQYKDLLHKQQVEAIKEKKNDSEVISDLRQKLLEIEESKLNL